MSASSNSEIVKLGGVPGIDYAAGDPRSASKIPGTGQLLRPPARIAVLGGRTNNLVPFTTTTSEAFAPPQGKHVPISTERCDNDPSKPTSSCVRPRPRRRRRDDVRDPRRRVCVRPHRRHVRRTSSARRWLGSRSSTASRRTAIDGQVARGRRGGGARRHVRAPRALQHPASSQRRWCRDIGQDDVVRENESRRHVKYILPLPADAGGGQGAPSRMERVEAPGTTPGRRPRPAHHQSSSEDSDDSGDGVAGEVGGHAASVVVAEAVGGRLPQGSRRRPPPRGNRRARGT